jgi:hypothetical protein
MFLDVVRLLSGGGGESNSGCKSLPVNDYVFHV